jgi:hypothetical protein
MPAALVPLKTGRHKVTNTAEKILEIPSGSDVCSVSGRQDLQVIIKISP